MKQVYAVVVRYEGCRIEWYIRSTSPEAAFETVRRQPGHAYDKFISAKPVYNYAGLHITEDNYT